LLVAAAAQAATREEDLAALRARIESMRGELEGRESDRREARDALRASEVAISNANRALHALERDAREARDAIAQLGTRRGAQERALEAQQEALGRLLAARAVASAAGGAPDFIRLALSGEDLADAARKLHYLTYVSRDAARVIDTQRAGLAELARMKADSEAKSQELAAIEARGRADREQLLKERREHRRVLERIAGEIRSAKKRIQSLLADESRLARLVEEIGKVLAARPGAGYRRENAAVAAVPDPAGSTDSAGLFSALKGRLRLPVRGELAGRFGGQRTAGAAAKGVFIRAPEGEPVRAVAAGRVVYSDWMRGFGNLLIVDHGEAYLSIYANNESLLKQVGDAVATGDTVATTGASGGNEETGLYFELRHLGRAFDPLRWVRLK
jgi:septal ring factor EnvC (AmiA/AmiB activator)